MKLTVVGKSPAWQDEGGACSSYLVSEGDTSILLDCGNGAFGALRKLTDPAGLDAIFISHLHADHFFDLVPFAFSLTNSLRGREVSGLAYSTEGVEQPIELYGPPASGGALESVCGVWRMPTMLFDTFEFSEYDPGGEVTVGPLKITFRAVPHYIETWAISVAGPDGKRLVFGADCSPNEALADFAAGADLLIAEATLAEPEPDPDDRGHMTPREAGEVARAAGVSRLVLTHIPDQIDPEWAVAEAGAAFDGPVAVAEGAMELDL